MPLRQPVSSLRRLRGTWGVHEITLARYGESRARLLVLPPDISTRERVLWRLLHVWPFGGFLLGAAATLALVPVAELPLAIVAGLCVWFLPLGAIWFAASGLLSRVRETWSTAPFRGDDGRVEQLDAIGARLDALEAAWRAGDGTEAAFRTEWAEVYAALAAAPVQPTR